MARVVPQTLLAGSAETAQPFLGQPVNSNLNKRPGRRHEPAHVSFLMRTRMAYTLLLARVLAWHCHLAVERQSLQFCRGMLYICQRARSDAG